MSHSKGYKWIMGILILGLILGLILPLGEWYGSYFVIFPGTLTVLDLKLLAILPVVTILILLIYNWAHKPRLWLWLSLVLTILSLVGFIFVVTALDGSLMIGGWLNLFSLSVVLILLIFRRSLAFDLGRVEYRDAILLQKKLDEIPKIDSSCEISIYRPSSLTGGASPVIVYLHGIKIGEIENGKTFSFSTHYATNTMKLVFEDDGTIIEETFPAEAGGSLRFKLNLPEGTLKEN